MKKLEFKQMEVLEGGINAEAYCGILLIILYHNDISGFYDAWMSAYSTHCGNSSIY